MSRSARPYSLGLGRGIAFAELPAEIEAALPQWMASATVAGAVELKPSTVWRVGAFAVKRFPAPTAWLRLTRRAPALRCAEACARIAPVATPAPLLALEVSAGPRAGESWLIVDFIEGEHLTRALRGDPRAVSELPAFFATMHEHGVLHGDLNAANLLWDGTRWQLIDLEGLRGPLHRLRMQAIARDQWSRVVGTLRDPEFVRPLHAEYCKLLGRGDAEREWPRIERRGRRLAQRYDRLLAERAAKG